MMTSCMQAVKFPRTLGLCISDKIDLPTEPESEETKRLWVTTYLRRMYELRGNNPDDPTEREIRMWLLAIDIMQIVSNITHTYDLMTTDTHRCQPPPSHMERTDRHDFYIHNKMPHTLDKS